MFFDPAIYNLERHREVLKQMLAGPVVVKTSRWPGGDDESGFKEKWHECLNCHDRLSCHITCKGCKSARYCSLECMTTNWTSSHKDKCRRMRKDRKKVAKQADRDRVLKLVPGVYVSVFGLTSAVGSKLNGRHVYMSL